MSALRRNRPLTVVVGGMVGRVPHQGGATWAVLQYLLGLRRLGHNVFFFESIDANSVMPARSPLSCSRNARYVETVMADAGLTSSWALLLEGTHETAGMNTDAVGEVFRRADLLLNLAGSLKDPLVEVIPLRAYVDLDPAFTQIWQETYAIEMGLDTHTHFLSVGQSIGSSSCPVPALGRDWTGMLPPVVLDLWPAVPTAAERWSSVANWRSYGSVEYAGQFYGQKAHSWRELLPLPALTGARYEVAMAIDPGDGGDLADLQAHGWHLVDPVTAAGSPDSYRRFIEGSRAELAIAKSGYVSSRSGWFSDRSVCYLSAGRPVVAQETGFSEWIPTGDGLCSFATLDEACEAVAQVEGDYERHSRGARRLAEEVFSSDKVLTSMMQAIGADQ
jgi:hypothetical protein